MGFSTYTQAGTDDNDTRRKRIDLPFVHIDVKKHADGTKDVDVKAPFVKVHNPAGEDNAEVKAPFTKVQNPSPAPSQLNPSTPMQKKTTINTAKTKGH
jgi:hypothetical protein